MAKATVDSRVTLELNADEVAYLYAMLGAAEVDRAEGDTIFKALYEAGPLDHTTYRTTGTVIVQRR